MATMSLDSSFSPRHSSTKRRHTLRMAGPLSRRKSAIVFEAGSQTPRQPHHLDVALALALKTPAGRYPVQIPLDKDLEHHARIIGRATRKRWRGTVEFKFREIQLFDKGIDDPDRIVLPDVVIDAFGK